MQLLVAAIVQFFKKILLVGVVWCLSIVLYCKHQHVGQVNWPKGLNVSVNGFVRVRPVTHWWPVLIVLCLSPHWSWDMIKQYMWYVSVSQTTQNSCCPNLNNLSIHRVTSPGSPTMLRLYSSCIHVKSTNDILLLKKIFTSFNPVLRIKGEVTLLYHTTVGQVLDTLTHSPETHGNKGPYPTQLHWI